MGSNNAEKKKYKDKGAAVAAHLLGYQEIVSKSASHISRHEFRLAFPHG